MGKEIKMNQKMLKQWAKEQIDQFFHCFSDAKEAYDLTRNYILKVWYGQSYSQAELPKLVSNYVKYTIGAFKEKDKFIITLMNPKTGAFGKAVIGEEDYKFFSWEYGLALAWARMNNKDYAIWEEEITMDKLAIGQHFLWKDCEWVITYIAYNNEEKYWHYTFYNITKRFVKDMTSNRKEQYRVKLID